jgi:hypothetical protein
MAVKEAKDFVRPGSKAEMLSDIAERKTALSARMRKNAGTTSGNDESDAARRDYDRLLGLLKGYGALEAPPMSALTKLLGKRERFLSGDLGEVLDGLEKLADLYAIWKRDWESLLPVAKKANKPESEYVAYKPELERYQKLRRASGQYH